MIDKFVDYKLKEVYIAQRVPKLFYIWGHAFEFDNKEHSYKEYTYNRNILAGDGEFNIEDYEDVGKSLADLTQSKQPYTESKYYKDANWKKIIDESRKFVGVVEGISESPCSIVLGINDIRENLGMIRTKTKPCCLLDGYNCDKYKYLKND